jgi:hypothetical protein
MADLKEIMEREYKRCQRDIATEASEIVKHQAIHDCLQDRACMLREFLQAIEKEQDGKQNDD